MIQDEQQVTLHMLAAAAEFRDARVLEIGCGPGRVTAMYADRPCLLVGMEPDSDMVHEAAARVPGVHCVQASGTHLPFRPGCFDIILFSLSLHHHPDPAAALAEARRAAVPGGRILVLEPVQDNEIQHMCNVFMNEDRELERVERFLNAEPGRVLLREEFDTEWVFGNFEAAAQYAFNYYSHPPDAAKRRAMHIAIGPKADDCPLVLTDTLRLTCLEA